MRKVLWAGMMASALISGSVLAADHREAPGVNLQPAADLGDLYVFKSPVNSRNVVLIMTVNPNSDPDFAASYAFDPDVLYRFAIDSTGDGILENKIDLFFGPVTGGVQEMILRLNNNEVARGQTTPGSSLGFVEPTILRSGPFTAFAGPVDDPFFFDGVGFQRFVAGLGGFRGEDSFAGFNVSAIAIELPFDLINGGKEQVAVEAFTFTSRPPEEANRGGRNVVIAGRQLEQFERTGNPAIATALVPSTRRDEFNQTRPADDGARFGADIVASLEAFGTPPATIALLASIAVPDTMKFDFGAPSGFPNGRLPTDDVIDTILSLVLDTAVSDGVDANDKPFEASFPYMAFPHQPSLDP